MAQFRLVDTPPFGVCLTCGTSACADGFVDLIAEVSVTREEYDIAGTVDVILCADCVDQATLINGGFSRKEAEKFENSVNNLQEELTKALDESASWQQRYENIVEIVSMMQLNGRDDSSEYFSSGGATGEPSPDLRLQEGSGETVPQSRKKQSSGSR